MTEYGQDCADNSLYFMETFIAEILKSVDQSAQHHWKFRKKILAADGYSYNVCWVLKFCKMLIHNLLWYITSIFLSLYEGNYKEEVAMNVFDKYNVRTLSEQDKRMIKLIWNIDKWVVLFCFFFNGNQTSLRHYISKPCSL